LLSFGPICPNSYDLTTISDLLRNVQDSSYNVIPAILLANKRGNKQTQEWPKTIPCPPSRRGEVYTGCG